MQVPYVTDAEIAAVKRLSRDERDDLKRQIIAAHPNDIFGTAKPSNNPNVAYIICPNCGNGSGKDRTPVQCNFKGDRWLYHCFARQDLEGDLLNLIANEEHLTLSNADDMARALTIGASMIGYNFNDSPSISEQANRKLPYKKSIQHNLNSSNPCKRFDRPAETKTASQSDSQPNLQLNSQLQYTNNNFDRLDESRSNLQLLFTSNIFAFYKNTFRGLTGDTLAKLKWGFLKNYKHPNNRFVFQAIIIQNDKGGILARAIEGTKKSNISPTGTTTICLPTDNNILFVVEGAIDAASIAQATNFQYGVIAIGGTSGIKHCVERLKELSLGKPDMFKIIVMLDHDSEDPDKDSGQVAAQKLVAELKQLGFAVVNKIICDEPRRDPNLILQEEGDEALRNRIETIVADSQNQFDAIQKEMAETAKTEVNIEVDTEADDKIADWEKINGVINPQLLAQIQNFAANITDVEDFADAATDTSTIKFLGYCKFYPFAHVSQKFFNELRAAVDKAKKNVKTWNKHISDTDKYNSSGIGAKRELDLSKKPADSDFALAAINPRLVNEEADKYAKKAKREHEKWLVQHKCDELNAQKEAERAAYAESPPTTQQEVPDCPIDLILPEGATFSDNGITYVDLSKPAKDGRPIVEVCHNPIVPTKFFLNAETGLAFYEVAIKINGRWRFQIFPARTFNDVHTVLTLSDFGLKISEPRLLVKFFAKFFSDNETNHRLPQKRIYSQPGWHDGEFILPTGTEDYTVRRDGIDYQSIFDTKGDKDAWLDTFKGIFKFGQEVPKEQWRAINCWAYACGVVLNAPVLKIVGLPNQQVHFWGDRSFAKTAAVKCALSIIGNPNEGKLLRNMAATDKNKLTFSAGLNDFAVGYDEAESASKFADIAKSSYDYFGGVINQANRRNGEVRPAEHFRGVQIMTGENPILEVDSAKGGALKRLIQIQVTTPFLDTEAASSLHVFLADNYGHFREAWIEYVTEHQAEFKQDIQRTMAILKASNEIDISDYESTNVYAIISAYVCFFHFLVMLGILDEVYCELAAKYATEIFGGLPTVSEIDDFDRVRLLLKSYLDSKSKFFYRETYDVDTTTAKSEPFEKYGIIFKNGDVAFFMGSFKKVFDELATEYSYNRFLSNSFNRKLLNGMSQRNKFKSIRYNDKKVNVYYLLAATFRTDDDTDDEQADDNQSYYDDYHDN